MPRKRPTRLDAQAAIKKIFQARSSLPSLTDLVDSLLKEFGGVNEFAREYKKIYDESTSAMVRARLLEGLNRLIQLNASQMEPPDLSMISEEDLAVAAAAAWEMMNDRSSGDSPESPGGGGIGSGTGGSEEGGETTESGGPGSPASSAA